MNDLPLKIEWMAPEHDYNKKSPEWFWALGIITMAMIMAAVILSNFLFAVLITLSGFSIALYGAKKPKIVKMKIGSGGIVVNKKHYNYDDVSHFWISYKPPHAKEIFLQPKKPFSPHVVIMMGDADPEIIHNLLSQFLTEKKIEESLIATIAKLLKF